MRLLEEDAKWIYEWAEPWMLSRTTDESNQEILAYGTPVIIFGNYAYGEKVPWARLVDDPAATSISVGEIDALLSGYASTIAARARTRESVIAQAVSTTN